MTYALLKPGDMVVSKPDTTVILWPELKVNDDPDNPFNVPRIYLLGDRDVVLEGSAIVVAILVWPDIVNGRIVMLLFDNHIGYNREMFLRLVE